MTSFSNDKTMFTAAVVRDTGGPFKLEQVSKNEPQGDEVLVGSAE
ncbi:hypothetical protein [Granulosicoccus antarcticus]|uniref:Uncharacterized protein n=1 Tax=Granulosicoccus antarcticus IMCC3135 TaxID=1192854 RepID=A0A2Z2NRT3_9GAMM|nr:hypothetical protein [Granulosicoccus antarcticus]ASJ73215.1 hypothetical protein IMCC3135_15665 [Granulosicoccus antarcticus IMCC3135]